MASGDGRAATQSIEVSGRRIEISHPDKIFFPGLGATKMDLVEYYLAVSGPILRATGGRPAMLQRFPEGALGKSFFQKRVPPGAPEWVQTIEVSTPNGTTSRALVIADAAHITWAVNLGCLGFHLWPFCVDDPEHADELRIDLDPQPGVSFDQVREAARCVRELLGELGIARLPQDEREPRAARLCATRAPLGLDRGPRRGRGAGTRARASTPGPGHRELVEGGAGPAGLR